MDRLDRAVRAYSPTSGPSPKLVKKPSFKRGTKSFPHSSSVTMSSSPAPPSRPRRPSQRPLASRTSHAETPEEGCRRTINSITAHRPVYDERLPPPNADLKIPASPSRSPSPPTEVIVGAPPFRFAKVTEDAFSSLTTVEEINSPRRTRRTLSNSSSGDSRATQR